MRNEVWSRHLKGHTQLEMDHVFLRKEIVSHQKVHVEK